MWRGVGSAAVMKVLVMGVTGLIGLVTSRVIIQNFGVDFYAQYGLLSSLPSLLPFADLGIAAVVINAVAESSNPRTDSKMRQTLVSAIRLLVISGAVIVAVAIVLTVIGAWPYIMGDGLLPGGNLVAGLCLALFGLALPLTIGPRILVGLGRNTTQIAIQVITAPLIMLMIGGCVILDVPAGAYIALATYIASAVVAAVAFIAAGRAISPQLSKVLRDVPRLRAAPGTRVIHMAWPMLVQMLALPIAMQTSRILVSHLGGIEELAEFNLANQIFGIALQTISAAGVALWPIFARARSGNRIETPWRPTVWFLIGGIAIAVAMAAFSPLLTSVVSDGQIQVSQMLVVSFVIFIALQAAKYPVGMYMTDLRGLRFQVLPTVTMIPVAIGGTFLLVPLMGAAGSVLAVSTAVLLCQVIPNIFFVRADLSRRRGDGGGSSGVESDPSPA